MQTLILLLFLGKQALCSLSYYEESQLLDSTSYLNDKSRLLSMTSTFESNAVTKHAVLVLDAGSGQLTESIASIPKTAVVSVLFFNELSSLSLSLSLQFEPQILRRPRSTTHKIPMIWTGLKAQYLVWMNLSSKKSKFTYLLRKY